MENPPESSLPTEPQRAASGNGGSGPPSHSPASDHCKSQILLRGRSALAQLLDAHDYAEDLGCSKWDFAVERETLHEAGLSNSDLSWLVCQQLLEHAYEVAPAADKLRAFRPGLGLSFADGTCFVLSDEGVSFARGSVSSDLVESAAPEPARKISPVPSSEPSEPVWDKELRELRVGDQLVKRFRVPAPNQELVLTVFQEDGWPLRIDDPLPPRHDIDPKRRLHDTVNCLNRNQRNPLIQFSGDGKGEGLRWKLVSAVSG